VMMGQATGTVTPLVCSQPNAEWLPAPFLETAVRPS
jgi:hypothetical protein